LGIALSGVREELLLDASLAFLREVWSVVRRNGAGVVVQEGSVVPDRGRMTARVAGRCKASHQRF